MSRDGWLPPGVEYSDLPGYDDLPEEGSIEELDSLRSDIELSKEMHTELIERRDHLIRQLLRDGESISEIATVIGLSEVRVRQIRREESPQ